MRHLILRLWHSPIFTSWGSRGSQLVRMIILLPLILKSFDEVQLSAWLLFSSVIFFSEMLSTQTMLIFSRMVALVSGGATDLTPIRDGQVQEKTGQPNWPLLERLYTTTQTLNAGLALGGLLLMTALGYFSLAPVVKGYAAAHEIWLAFMVFVAGTCVVEFFKKYRVVLRGMNHVALSNRWNTLINLLSPLAGAAVLLSGGGIIELAVIMQLILVGGVVIERTLLLFVAQREFRGFAFWGWDLQIVKWALQPLWRSLIQMLANRGGTRISAISLARHADPAVLAPILLAVRLLDMLEGFSDSPISSHSPRFGRLLAAGKIEQFRRGIVRAFQQSFVVHVAGVIVIGLFAGAGLELMGSETKFIPMGVFFSMAIAHTLMTTVRKSLMISIIGNHVVAVERFVMAALLTIALAFTLIPIDPFWGFVASAYLPVIFVVNIKPLKIGCKTMRIGMANFASHTLLLPFAFLLFVALGVQIHKAVS